MRSLTAFLLLLLLSSPALAQGTSRTPKSSPPAPPTNTTSGSTVGCRYRGGNGGATSTIKDCGVVRNGGEFSVRIARGQAVIVRTDEPILTVVPAQSREVRMAPTTTFVVYDLIDRLPPGWSSTIQTASYAVTLRFRATTGAGDSQIHIARADRLGRDAELERRVAEEKSRLQADFDRRYAALDKTAALLARAKLLGELQDGFSATTDLKARPVRNDFLVLRAEQLIRIGDLRFLQITVENRDTPTFSLGALEAWIERGRKLLPTTITSRCATSILRASQRTRCTIAFDSLDEHVRIRLSSRDGKRSVTLSGINLR